MAVSSWTPWTPIIAVLLVSVRAGVADADLVSDMLQSALEDGVNSTVSETVSRMIRVALVRNSLLMSSISSLDGNLHQQGQQSKPWNPPYPEPPPSSVELCAQRGFKCERHVVKTDDGYLVALIHVLGRIGAPRASGNTPVLVQHGLLMSSDAWLMRKDDGNLPMILSDAGFDVWVGNYRGNAVSPHVHDTLSPKSRQFWDFSWHEMGLFDLAAMVDYVLSSTDSGELQYVGHSMGTTGLMVLLSTRPEYNRKIRLASFLAPVAYVSTLRSHLFRQLAAIAPRIKEFLVSNRVWNVLPRNAALHHLLDLLCLLPGTGKILCDSIGFTIAGPSPEHVLPDFGALIAAYMPAGTTIRIMEHYYEVARTGKFRPLGYGMGDPNPGNEYNMSAVTAPVALYYSQNDYFVHPPDVERLAADLQNVYHKREIPDPTFNHLDFILASDGRQLLYNELLAVMQRMEANYGDKHDHNPTRNDLVR